MNSLSALHPDERYRLYIDESGDHVYKKLEEPGHRFLCLIGCWIRGKDYGTFHKALEAFKQAHIPHNPDEPLILHREDIVNRRGSFWRLRDPVVATAFDESLLELLRDTPFRIVAVIIDKMALQEKYPDPSHPYHLAMGFMLQRYCGYLNHINRQGDVMAESRGGAEDRLLKASYEWVHAHGAWVFQGEAVRRALTSEQLKVKPKSANIAGLQLADLLANPVRQLILAELQWAPGPMSPFVTQLAPVIETKYNRHLYDGRIWGYGKVHYPK